MDEHRKEARLRSIQPESQKSNEKHVVRNMRGEIYDDDDDDNHNDKRRQSSTR